MIEKKDKLLWIDAVRGMAITLVFFYHWYGNVGHPFSELSLIDWLFRLGNYGVQLFFVASAFTLMMSVVKEKQRTQSICWKSFHVRRFFRIAPAYYFAAAVYPLWRIYESATPIPDVSSYVLTLSFFNGFSSFSQNNIVPGEWSISAEYFFYFCFPLFYWATGSKNRMLTVLFLSVFVSGVVPLLVYKYLVSLGVEVKPGFPYYLPLRWSAVFFIGALTFCLYSSRYYVYVVRWRYYIPACIVFLLLGFFVARDVLPVFYLLISVVWCLLVLYLSALVNVNWLKPMAFIGQVSFSCYLAHFWCLSAAKIICEGWLMLDMTTLPALGLMVLIAAILTISISFLTYTFIEVPGQKVGKMIINKYILPSHKRTVIS